MPVASPPRPAAAPPQKPSAAPKPKELLPPQPGPQEEFLASDADIAIYGGAAGGGKTYALLLEALRHRWRPGFTGVVFRRTLADVKKAGSLLDASMQLFPEVDGTLRFAELAWEFPSGAKIVFGHLQHEASVLDWHGAEVALLCFDELTHFSRSQFFYMLSRNRSTSGMRPLVRASTNPDSDSWVKELIQWWIDPATGVPIRERGGKLRWFARIGDTLEWADTRDELVRAYPTAEPKSLTFIPARLEDNRALVAADPGYRANLLALPRVERERLLGGNWKIRPAAGLHFQRQWCPIVDAIPAGTTFVRGWDLAATAKTESNDPDWTVGIKIGRTPDKRFILAHHLRLRGSAMEVERAIANTASADGKEVKIALPQDPGQAGKSQAANLIRLLAHYDVRAARPTGDKVTRFAPFSAQAQAGNVLVLRGPWNETLFAELEAFPEGAHDDDADAISEAFARLTVYAPHIPMVAPIFFPQWDKHPVVRAFTPRPW